MKKLIALWKAETTPLLTFVYKSGGILVAIGGGIIAADSQFSFPEWYLEIAKGLVMFGLPMTLMKLTRKNNEN